MNVPNPGSNEAVERGCKCPVLDNSHGKGYMMQKGIFVKVVGCPLHGAPDSFQIPFEDSTKTRRARFTPTAEEEG